ncbi:hypothetical protein [endosymbiont GvMRE of Glomus versiforme]|uniref:hypothetical protein n=1 Tax=endosymbiont GvMRE of Glomus versiforme TaxID=2039283 RepID=UPI000EE1A912|nr:hypothetical protein [endosymbiont GvMRE of Glomus versiforme]RHZ37359.1 hypothetical protein GvMRE_I1g612 [endosymbiont GvMRE of Glomus versiforme]
MFCYKCAGIMENEKCLRCDNNSLNQNSLDLSPICLGFLPTEPYGRMIMAMGQLFDDQRRRWEGYWIYFYPHEFVPPENKPLNLLHIHFKGQEGEARVYLPSCQVEVKWGKIKDDKKIIKFVQQNLTDIMNKIESELKKADIKN